MKLKFKMFYVETVALGGWALTHIAAPTTNTHLMEPSLLQTFLLTHTYRPLSRYFHTTWTVHFNMIIGQEKAAAAEIEDWNSEVC